MDLELCNLYSQFEDKQKIVNNMSHKENTLYFQYDSLMNP